MKTKIALEWTLKRFTQGSKNCFLWTLTIPDSDYSSKKVRDYSARCTEFFNRLRKLDSSFSAVRVFEFGEKTGRFHCHFVTVRRENIKKFIKVCKACGLGRIHVKKIPVSKVGYIAKYVTKGFSKYCPIPEGLRHELRIARRGMRMWGTTNFKSNLVKNCVCSSPFAIVARVFYSFIRRYVFDHKHTLRALFHVMNSAKWELDHWINCLGDEMLFWGHYGGLVELVS